MNVFLCSFSYASVWLNKPNLWDLIAVTGLVILLKLDSNQRFLACVALKFDGWPRQTMGHLFYTTSSFVHYFKSISEFKLELQSGNAQFGSKLVISSLRVTLKFHGWPWKTIGHLFYTTSSFVHCFRAMGEFKQELPFGNAQFGSKSTILCLVWPWYLTNDLEKQ